MLQTAECHTQTEEIDWPDVGIDRKRHSSAPMLEFSIDSLPGDISIEDLSGLDWKQRCQRLANLNEQLERQLAQLVERRVAIEGEIKHLT